MKTKTYTVQEFGSQQQVSVAMLENMDKAVVEQIIKENLQKDALGKGYTEVSAPEVLWGEQAFRLAKVGDEYSWVSCNPADEGAFFYVGARMTVIDKDIK
jgi:hypothetical protein